MSSKAVYFNSGKSLLSCDQMICRSNQGLVLSSGVSCKHRSLLLEVGHTGLAFPERLDRVLPEVSFLIVSISILQSVMLKVFNS